MEGWQRVRDALSAREFSLVPGAGRDLYQGNIIVGSVPVSLEIEITDYDFLDLPKISVINRDKLPKRLSAHIVSDGSLCYADKATFLLDRYQPDRSVNSCLEQAKATLSTLLHGNPTVEFMAELAAYWSTTPYCLIDDPKRLERVVFGICVFDNGPQILLAGATKARLENWARAAGGTFTKTFDAPVVHAVDAIRPPSVGTSTLKAATDWLELQTNSLRALIDITIGTAEDRPALLIVGTNALIGFRADETPLLGQAHKGGFRKKALPSLWKKEAAKARIETFHCVPASHKEITSRSLDGPAPLSNRRLALIGCGAIGSYLARALVQLGGGHEASLLVIDHDTLKPENLGRHMLGARHLWRNKAVALAAQLQADFPDVSLNALDARGQSAFDRLFGYDLVIDAAGDQQFSDALNAFALAALNNDAKFPPILFAMLFGNGLAGQSYLARWETGTACYRCLKPRFEADWRYNPLKLKAMNTATAVRPCSQGAFVPYAVSASLQAAGLAAGHAKAFFSTEYYGDLRTVQVEPSMTVGIPYRNVKSSDSCPACLAFNRVKI